MFRNKQNREISLGHNEWDKFWDIVSQKRILLKLIYHYQFQKYKSLLSKIQLANNLNILELGAGTGFLTQKLLKEYGGKATLLDNNNLAYHLFREFQNKELDINYLREDIFKINLADKFDIVYSDGLIEHFEIKNAIINLHKKFLAPNGYIFFFVPHASRVFSFVNKIGPKVCASELFSEQGIIKICKKNDLKIINLLKYFFSIGVLCQPN